MRGTFIDLAGQRFGKITVVERAIRERNPAKKKSYAAYWLCKCDCGAEEQVRTNSLTSGEKQHCRACGMVIARRAWRAVCIERNTTHGYAGSRTYNSWSTMLQRCCNPKNPKYHDYGGRGISVCERWLEFTSFLADMGERPECMSLDRIDNNGNYEPNNCRWATQSQQCRNMRRRPHFTRPYMKLVVSKMKRAATLPESELREVMTNLVEELSGFIETVEGD